ncbi:MAG: NB-ARC domain-containing protein, partial [Ktedonobacteraceae bacterium]
ANNSPTAHDQQLPIWHMPHMRNPFFTGREHVLARLHQALHHEHAAVLSQSYALSGLGGIGKTQTALEYAHRYASDYTAIFWISAETTETLLASFTALAAVLDLPEKEEHEQKRVAAAVLRWLNSHDKWLLIFDNVEEVALAQDFLPTAHTGSLLFTSRRQALGITAQTLDLEIMTSEESRRFLLHRARLLDPTATLAQLPPTDEAAVH